MRRLTTEQLATFALAALKNARRLYDDAVLLHQSGRTPGAFMTLGFAADELGKHVIIAAMPSRDDTEVEWRKFWKRTNSHVEKLGTTAFHSSLHNLWDLESPPVKAKEFHHKRLDATYVDLRDGLLRVPADTISPQDLSSAFEMVTDELLAAEELLRSMDICTLTRHMQNVRDDRQELPLDQNERLKAMAEAVARRMQLFESNSDDSRAG